MKQRPSVLFLSHSPREEQPSRVYRCTYQAKQLAQGGLDAKVVYFADATDAMVQAADVLVFSRLRWDERVLDLVQRGKRSGKLLCGDLDDRIFAPWDVDLSGYMRSRARPKSTVSTRHANIERDTLRLLPAFDVVTVSTPALKEELEGLGISAHITPNALDTERCAPIQRERSRLSRVLIMSGTQTHDEDLRRIAPGLAHFLVEHHDVECTLLGALAVAGPLHGLPNVRTEEVLPLTQLYPYIGQFDLCLVPLEPTRFNDCKSGVKFIDCGVVSVPVLASPRREYRSIVRDGENGFLAGDDAQSWYDALCRLYAAPDRVRRAAAAAHQTVLSEHTVASRKSSLADYFRSLWAAHSASKRRQEARP